MICLQHESWPAAGICTTSEARTRVKASSQGVSLFLGCLIYIPVSSCSLTGSYFCLSGMCTAVFRRWSCFSVGFDLFLIGTSCCVWAFLGLDLFSSSGANLGFTMNELIWLAYFWTFRLLGWFSTLLVGSSHLSPACSFQSNCQMGWCLKFPLNNLHLTRSYP